jgi:hypothetical protein
MTTNRSSGDRVRCCTCHTAHAMRVSYNFPTAADMCRCCHLNGSPLCAVRAAPCARPRVEGMKRRSTLGGEEGAGARRAHVLRCACAQNGDHSCRLRLKVRRWDRIGRTTLGPLGLPPRYLGYAAHEIGSEGSLQQPMPPPRPGPSKHAFPQSRRPAGSAPDRSAFAQRWVGR